MAPLFRRARTGLILGSLPKLKGPAAVSERNELSANGLAELARIIRDCVQEKWNLFPGGEDAMNTVIKLRLRFRPDGRFSAPPQVTNPNPQDTAYFLGASKEAIRAATACEPYSLPADKYEAWREVLMTCSLRHIIMVNMRPIQKHKYPR